MERRLIVKHTVLIALSLVVGICTLPLESRAQAGRTDNAASLAASSQDDTATEQQSSRRAKRAARKASAEAESALADGTDETEATGTKVDVEGGESGQNDIVCKHVKRPGSNIARKVCYSEQERLANEEARKEALKGQLGDLEREQRWRDEIINEAIVNGRRPSGFGLGPD